MQLTTEHPEHSEPLAPKTRKVHALGKALGYILVGAVCCAVVAAQSYGLGFWVGSRLADTRPIQKMGILINGFLAFSDRAGWGWVGAVAGATIGLGIAALGRKSVGLGFLGAILGA